jgi:hypothetical protein
MKEKSRKCVTQRRVDILRGFSKYLQIKAGINLKLETATLLQILIYLTLTIAPPPRWTLIKTAIRKPENQSSYCPQFGGSAMQKRNPRIGRSLVPMQVNVPIKNSPKT